jgi:transcriptional regulator GlxA family with amidase domain
VAEEVGLSRRSLDRRFRAALRRSAAEELLQVRLNRTCLLLRQTSLPISQIAGLTGFTDQNHLGRCFRRNLKLSPTGYRKQFQSV